MDGLKQKIKELIECLYNCIYDADLKVEKEGDWYYLTLYLQNQVREWGGNVYARQCSTDEEFLEFLKEEFKKNRLDLASHAQLRIYGNIETQEGI